MTAPKTKSLLEKKAEDSQYRTRQSESYEAFKLEAQLLFALERKGWSYSDLAAATKTSKSNVSRDLRGGGILSATFSRINRMADVLGMKLIALLLPKEQVQFLLPKIENFISDSFNTTYEGPEVRQHGALPASPYSPEKENLPSGLIKLETDVAYSLVSENVVITRA